MEKNTSHEIRHIGTECVWVYAENAPVIAHEHDASTLISQAYEYQASWLALSVNSLTEDFRLSTGLAGAIVQKLVNYRLKLAIVGDVTPWVERSNPFRDLVLEANGGNTFWFVPNLEVLEQRLIALH